MKSPLLSITGCQIVEPGLRDVFQISPRILLLSILEGRYNRTDVKICVVCYRLGRYKILEAQISDMMICRSSEGMPRSAGLTAEAYSFAVRKQVHVQLERPFVFPNLIAFDVNRCL